MKSVPVYQNLFGETNNAVLARWGRWRTKVMRPLLAFLTALKVSPDAVSLLSFACAIMGAALLVSNTLAATVFVTMHLLLDTVDGSLARYQGSATVRGKYVDFLVDTIGLVLITVAAVYGQITAPQLSFAYLATYLLLLGVIIWSTKLGLRVRNIVRSKDIFFIFLAIQLLWQLNFTNSFLLVATIYNIYCVALLLQKISASGKGHPPFGMLKS